MQTLIPIAAISNAQIVIFSAALVGVLIIAMGAIFECGRKSPGATRSAVADPDDEQEEPERWDFMS